MKHVFALRLFLVLLLGALAACGKDEDNPEPAAKYSVQVRYTYDHLENLQAVVKQTVQVSNDDVDVALFSAQEHGTETSRPFELTAAQSSVRVELSFENVVPNGGIRPESNSRLVAEVFVDGKVKNSLTIDANTAVAAGDPYVRRAMEVKF